MKGDLGPRGKGQAAPLTEYSSSTFPYAQPYFKLYRRIKNSKGHSPALKKQESSWQREPHTMKH